ncbi:uroporphyrin-III C-methyltransferase [Bacillus thuringiensis]|uniref:Uroporphyrinogen-III C-methyltransferase n=1 Tax=Bacillus thuringiensis TaxID=1428 RepID=A0A9W3XIX2_BACTU|nr:MULTISPECIES: uroporphyrin-III C-methyltransferase [Bacillus cereus group]AQY38694.1 uroporphyrinogen-III C-methyltransferase [Bacillus thuringiensis]EJR05645.1 uroporphyrinogen-III C-methyltransferase [Bacillus cereus MSX-A1]MDR4149502.1 uroporphyrin-III C-methyltransferase [Bacillus thuringiensis]MDR4291164.1 uroporphyrin-III C-methyltransferase [Bacillus cereus]MEC3574613.1 uroporphyrin-III C-methyltransferase [Bacillus thuringiensis]
MNGYVYLVGAGPGDEGLITKKAIDCLKRADIVLYDRLLNPFFLSYTKETCELMYCGKMPKNHIMRQEMINAHLLQFAQEGKIVVRLKGGDPSIFGRVGEEAETLAAANVPYEIVPGITSSIAASSYAGIPLTHRNYSNSITLLTGHAKGPLTDHGKYNSSYNSDTIAYYMGIKNLPTICENLLQAGKKKDTPVAVIEWGTTGKQRVVTGTLSTIVSIVKDENISNPSMTIVGDVVTLRNQIAWKERKPLHGKKVLLASATNKKSAIKQMLQESGAEIYQIPIFQKKEYTLTSEQINKIFNVDRLVFCSAESVDILVQSCCKYHKDIRSLQAELQYMNLSIQEKLMQYGLLSKPAQFSSNSTIYLGRNINRIAVIQEKIGAGSYMMTHEYTIDHRFDEIHSRMLSEFSWDSIVFEGRASIDTFLAEIKRLGFINILTLPFSYTDVPTLYYANKVGFHNVDEQLQDMIMKKDLVVR